MTTKSSQDLWIEPTAPLGDAVEQSGPSGAVCEAIGADAKKNRYGGLSFSPDLPFDPDPVPSSVTRVIILQSYIVNSLYNFI